MSPDVGAEASSGGLGHTEASPHKHAHRSTNEHNRATVSPVPLPGQPRCHCSTIVLEHTLTPLLSCTALQSMNGSEAEDGGQADNDTDTGSQAPLPSISKHGMDGPISDAYSTMSVVSVLQRSTVVLVASRHVLCTSTHLSSLPPLAHLSSQNDEDAPGALPPIGKGSIRGHNPLANNLLSKGPASIALTGGVAGGSVKRAPVKYSNKPRGIADPVPSPGVVGQASLSKLNKANAAGAGPGKPSNKHVKPGGASSFRMAQVRGGNT
jgi:hypothetical protein